VELGVSDHFLAPDKKPTAMFRKHLILEQAGRLKDSDSEHPVRNSLRSYIGDHWGVVLFADISGFTSITEKLWHQNRTALCLALKQFYKRAGVVVDMQGGVIDKFIGDELMALFFEGTNEGKGEVATRSVDCARQLLNIFRELEREFKKALTLEDESIGDIDWKLKVGMEAGALHIMEESLPNGEIELCAVGRAVNFASRIKGLAGPYSVTLGQTLRSKLTQEALYSAQQLTSDATLKGVKPGTAVFTLTNP
jgi:adenylate cyclase